MVACGRCSLTTDLVVTTRIGGGVTHFMLDDFGECSFVGGSCIVSKRERMKVGGGNAF